jgi:uncharacterized protein with gpF-like domain
VKPRQRNPALPGTSRDRTGTAGILRRAVAEIRKRYTGLQREVLAIFDGIRIVQTNDAGTMPRTIYALTPEEMASVSYALRQALDRWIASGREAAHAFWYSAYIDEASQLGAAQAVANLTNLSNIYAAARTLRDVVFSEAYRNRVAMAQIKSYEHWTGLAAGMKSELSQIIGRAVVDGKNPKAARAEIMERLGVSKGRAMGYAQTDITDTLRQARLAEDERAEETLGIVTGELWTSAFLPTTRPTHAARSGRVYTREEVQDFYGRDGNRYRCHCSITSCLLDADGKPILSDTLKAAMRKEREVWEKAQESAP